MNNEKIKIGQLCTLVSGATNSLFTREASEEEKNIKVLKGADLDQEGQIVIDNMEEVRITTHKDISHYMLQEGDVVVMARGSAIRAGFVTKSISEAKILASANFIIIRSQQNKLRGEVITAYLNSPLGQSILLGLSIGAAIQHIPASKLKELEIPVPSIQVQNKIAQLYYASKEAYESTLELAEQQKRTANAKILNLIQKEAA